MKFLLVCVFALLLVACSNERPGGQAETAEAGSDSPLNVIATIFPQFDFVRRIGGDRVDLSMLISPGAEAHAFEPTPRDIVELSRADLIIYVGGHGDEWLERILASLDADDLRTVALVDLVHTVEALVVPGMEDAHHHHGGHGHGHHDHDHDHDDHDHDHDHHDHDHDHDDHDHDHDHHDHHHHHHDHDIDEHVWTSPQNAIAIVEALTEILAEMDPQNAYYFRENAARFVEELCELDCAFAEIVAEGVRSTVIFGDRFPFRYLMDAYGLTYYAAFPGCATETMASPGTIAFLIDKVNSENIPVVFYIEFSTRLITDVITEATGTRALELHSVHNVSQADFDAGITYLDLMRRNAERLREALS